MSRYNITVSTTVLFLGNLAGRLDFVVDLLLNFNRRFLSSTHISNTKVKVPITEQSTSTKTTKLLFVFYLGFGLKKDTFSHFVLLPSAFNTFIDYHTQHTERNPNPTSYYTTALFTPINFNFH